MDIDTYPKSRSIRATRMAEEPGLDYQCHFVNVMSAEKQAIVNQWLTYTGWPALIHTETHCRLTGVHVPDRCD